MKKITGFAALLCGVLLLVSCSKSDEFTALVPTPNAKHPEEIMKVVITNIGNTSSFTDLLVLQTVTSDNRKINISGENWEQIIDQHAFATQFFYAAQVVRAQREFVTSDKVTALTVAYNLTNQSSNKEEVYTQVQFYSNNKLVHQYKQLMTENLETNNLIVAVLASGEVVNGKME